MGLVYVPTGGYVPDVGAGVEPGSLSPGEREFLRSLARRVAEIAAAPKQEERRRLWRAHNRLQQVRPLVLLWPEDGWLEIIPPEGLTLRDPYWRQWEWILRQRIHREEHWADDFVIEPDIHVPAVCRGIDWGLHHEWHGPEDARGARGYSAPALKRPEDLDKLTYPVIEVQEEATRQRMDAVGEVLGDILPVRRCYGIQLEMIVVDTAVLLRGPDQFMIDMYERPAWVHELLSFICEGFLRYIKALAAQGLLDLNTHGQYTDSGGVGYSDELPAPGFDGQHLRLRDLWGFADAQYFCNVSPAQHEEFSLPYDIRLLQEFGLNSYGCCEPLSDRLDRIKKIPRLRRVSISPWANVERAATELQDGYIFSWKPHPSWVTSGFDPEGLRHYVRQTLEATRGCVLEIVLKDTITLERDPGRLDAWVRIVREEIECAK